MVEQVNQQCLNEVTKGATVMQPQESFTIKELSELFGISRQAISKHVAKLDSSYIAKNSRGYKIILLNGARELASNLGNQELLDKLSVSEDDKQESIDIESESIVALKLLDQLQVKDEQIATLQRLLDQQQQLTLNANHQIEQMQTQINLLQAPIKQTDTDQEEPIRAKETEAQSKTSFFARFFGRS